MIAITKKLFPVLMLWLIAGSAFSQAMDAESQEILEKVKTRYQAYKDMKIELTQIIRQTGEEDEKMNATLWLKGDMFKLDYDNQTLMTDTEKYWIYYKEDNEVNISWYEEDDDNTFKPSDIFNLYEKDFQYMLSGTGSRGDEKFWIIKFNPLNKDVDYHTIKLYINQKDYSLAQATIIDKEQNQLIFQIRKITPNLNLSDNFFRFDPSQYKDILITDQTQY